MFVLVNPVYPTMLRTAVMKTLAVICAVVAMTATGSAAIIEIDLLGKGGVGLLGSNETNSLSGTPGSGGEVGAGILFNDVSLQLTINIAWGSSNGFTNLTGTTTGGHIHGATSSVAPASYNQTAGVLIGLNSLPGWNSSASGGGFSGTVTLTSAQATQLLNGQFYLNVHTTLNSNGEIRGQLIPATVPEPSITAFIVSGLAGAIGFRRRR